MIRRLLLASLLAVCCISVAAQDKGIWRSASQNASAITGDIGIAEATITMNFLSFPIAHIRTLKSAEIGALFDADSSGAAGGNLYRLRIAAGQRFMHKNTLCGTEDTEWMVTYVEGRSLHVAFFSGSAMPTLTFEALQNSTDRCGTFTYSR